MQLGLDSVLHGAAILGAHICIVFCARLCQMVLQSRRHVKVLCKKVLRKILETPNYACPINASVQRPHQQSWCAAAVLVNLALSPDCSQISLHCQHTLVVNRLQ